MSTLVNTVHVTDENGDNHIFSPGDSVPKWAKEKITNPKAWAESPTAATSAAPADFPLPIPAKGGPKATAEAWGAYAVQEIAARGLKIEIPADATRGDIIEALEGAGIPTEE